MARIFVTGSTTGVGRNAAEELIREGHDVVLHARTESRAEALNDIAPSALAVLIGDLASLAQTRNLAQDLNAIGPMDAIIHNAGIIDDSRTETEDGLPRVPMVNAIAPYMLSVLADRPGRLIFTGSSMHTGHAGVLDDLQWTSRTWSKSAAYGESKLLDCVLAAGLARHWPYVLCHAVDPGWVPTRMGGPSASDDLEQAHLTQCWLATSDDVAAHSTGGYWHQMRRRNPDQKVSDPVFQDAVLEQLAELSGVRMSEAPSR